MALLDPREAEDKWEQILSGVEEKLAQDLPPLRLPAVALRVAALLRYSGAARA